MLVNPFTPFDAMPLGHSWVSHWVLLLAPVVVFPVIYYVYPSWACFLRPGSVLLDKEIKPFVKDLNVHVFNYVCVLFMIILFMNVLGLTPYTFTVTSHLSINMPMAVTVFSCIVMFFVTHNFKDFFLHMVPYHCPTGMIPLMVILETIGLFIRPVSLCVRLTINMIAGHLILAVANSFASVLSSYFAIANMLNSLLLMLEIGVAVIQAYVFTCLVAFYMNESYLPYAKISALAKDLK